MQQPEETVAELSSLNHGDYLVANQTPNVTSFLPDGKQQIASG
jgi:hypothetical protein